MEYILLGKTGLMVSHVAFSTIALETSSKEEGVNLLRDAYENGINLFEADCSHNETLEMLGYAFYGMRKEVFISCKTNASDQLQIQSDLIKSLDALNSNYVDIFTIHNDQYVPSTKTNDGIYNALRLAKADGNIKFTGFSTNSVLLAKEALESALYDVITLNYNLSIFQDEQEEKQLFLDFLNAENALLLKCGENSGGNANVPILFGHLHSFENIAQMWCIQNNDALQQILYFEKNPPQIDDKFLEEVEKERGHE